MQKEVRQYKIAYAKCKKGGIHNHEPLNIVCLSPGCLENNLICSICKTEHHADHTTQPLKLYIDQLKGSFVSKDVSEEINKLDNRRNEVLATLHETVVNVSNRFRELEVEIIRRFKTAREKIEEVEALRRGFEGIYDILATPNHPDLAETIRKYSQKVVIPPLASVERISALETSIIQELKSTIAFYVSEETKFVLPGLIRVQHPAGIVFDGQNLEQIAGNKMNLCLFSDPITPENHRVSVQILTDNIKLVLGVISMEEFKKFNSTFDPTKANSKSIYWISSDNKGANYNSNSINCYTKNQVFDLSLKKNQLIVNRKKSKQFAAFTVKDSAAQWYFFLALLGPGKVQVSDKKIKK